MHLCVACFAAIAFMIYILRSACPQLGCCCLCIPICDTAGGSNVGAAKWSCINRHMHKSRHIHQVQSCGDISMNTARLVSIKLLCPVAVKPATKAGHIMVYSCACLVVIVTMLQLSQGLDFCRLVCAGKIWRLKLIGLRLLEIR